MPSQILHHLFGLDALAGAVRRLASVSAPCRLTQREVVPDRHAAAFALGCQGPDLFYHNRRTRPVAIEYGTLIHRRGYGRLAAELLAGALGRRGAPGRQAGGDEFSALTAYALGFISHAFLDRALHPYIVYRAGWIAASKPETHRYAHCHPFLERILDVQMLELLRGGAAASWDQDGLLASVCASPPEGLPELLERALAAAYPERAGGDAKLALRIRNALADAAYFYRMTSPRRTDGLRLNPGSSLLALVYPQGLPLDVDYLNLGKTAWRNPCGAGVEDRRSVPELYADSRPALEGVLADAVAGCCGNGPDRDSLATAIGDGSLSLQDDQGLPCAPCWSDPFPLARILEQQGQRRTRRGPI